MELFDKATNTEESPPTGKDSLIKDAIQNTCSGLALFCRDADLPYELTHKYSKGMILRERGFVDTTALVGGLKTSHRYLILSNHMTPLFQFSGNKQWGLCVANRDSRFLVLGKAKYKDKRVTILLHLNGDTWQSFKAIDMSFSQSLLNECYNTIKKCAAMEPIDSVSTDEWLARCQFPIGMSDEGVFFPIDD